MTRHMSCHKETLWVLVKLWYDPGAQKPKDIPFKGLAKWLGLWVGMMRDCAVWIEGYASHALSAVHTQQH